MAKKQASKASRFIARLKRSWRVRTERLPHHLHLITKRLKPDAGGNAEPLAGRFCLNPFTQFDLEQGGAAFTCCSGWLPTPIGKLSQQQSLMDIWNGQTIQRIRASMYDGSFRYCRHDVCPYIQNNSLPSVEEAEAHPVLGEYVKRRQMQPLLPELPQRTHQLPGRGGIRGNLQHSAPPAGSVAGCSHGA